MWVDARSLLYQDAEIPRVTAVCVWSRNTTNTKKRKTTINQYVWSRGPTVDVYPWMRAVIKGNLVTRTRIMPSLHVLVKKHLTFPAFDTVSFCVRANFSSQSNWVLIRFDVCIRFLQRLLMWCIKFSKCWELELFDTLTRCEFLHIFCGSCTILVPSNSLLNPNFFSKLDYLGNYINEQQKVSPNLAHKLPLSSLLSFALFPEY